MATSELSPLPLAPNIRSRYIEVRDLRMHFLEAGWESGGRKLVVLLHGFPEIAFSYRKIAGYHVVAPDQRGYGRTTGWDISYTTDLTAVRLTNLATDVVALVYALGYSSVAMVVGHDFGSPVASTCALYRPDIFQSCVLMSAPFAGPPKLPSRGPHSNAPSNSSSSLLHSQLASLPRPRKHYHEYYTLPGTNAEMMSAQGGLKRFFRAYFHMKSGDWAGNEPRALKGWIAEELAHMPTYYIMDAAATMPQSVVEPTPNEVTHNVWLPDADLAVYVSEYSRTTFQGGLNWYRVRLAQLDVDQCIMAGKPFPVPLLFVGGSKDWGVRQSPGVAEAMQTLENFRGMRMVEGAGHWVQQERCEEVNNILMDFLGQMEKETAKTE
ncbi:hypothetical protein HDU93_007618 [Gonapodya sp. JEL0774]|nr:hypothetical protein HDU93_007618 [Gonapodya sp. JEL0774]